MDGSRSKFTPFYPEAAIYSFEPLRECYEQLLKNMGHVPKFRAFNFALGSEAAETKIHKAEFTPSSSILRMRELHKQAFPFTTQASPEKIAIKRLDDVTGDLELTRTYLKIV